jgi:hypothetical protein
MTTRGNYKRAKKSRFDPLPAGVKRVVIRDRHMQVAHYEGDTVVTNSYRHAKRLRTRGQLVRFYQMLGYEVQYVAGRETVMQKVDCRHAAQMDGKA